MIKKLYLCLNHEKADANIVEQRLIETCSNAGMVIVENAKEADCVITIGGDGTFLFGSRIALENAIPLAGINLGRFGFLPSFSPLDPQELFRALNDSEPNIRCVLDVDLPQGQFNAINEIVIERKSVERAARLTLISSPPIFGTLQQKIKSTDPDERNAFINAQMDEVTNNFSVYSDEQGNATKGSTFVCDGIIVATPLGSTAYSSSSGGPAISPYSNVMSVTFNALHHPRIPPVVLTNNENLYLRTEETCVVVCDGRQVGEIQANQAVRFCIGEKLIKVFDKPASVLSKLAHAFGADRIT